MSAIDDVPAEVWQIAVEADEVHFANVLRRLADRIEADPRCPTLLSLINYDGSILQAVVDVGGVPAIDAVRHTKDQETQS